MTLGVWINVHTAQRRCPLEVLCVSQIACPGLHLAACYHQPVGKNICSPAQRKRWRLAESVPLRNQVSVGSTQSASTADQRHKLS